MKIITFPENDRDFKVSYHITNEGGNFFLCYYKHASVGRTDPKDAWRTLGVAKFTDTGKALKEWCLTMHEQHGATTDDPIRETERVFANRTDPQESVHGAEHHERDQS